ncbi:DNA-3-methyladenine glycosylase I [Corynebacterium confusum]|uniref:DNA-3-methyladenine glycosylase I n=1 Tax=uncultured Corynebacterium sp. TaxID=159447 RepID=UPI0025CFF59F|nr:DNA-3-methyladenine glycosylase I [uncultured Corynebacterium sp.]
MDTTGTGPLTGPDGLARTPWAAADELLRDYYDTEWGLPVYSEAELYERLVLEGFQAGLSWRLILSRRPAFRAAFAGFDPDAVAAFGTDDVERLANDATIIRNRRKIQAAIDNARATVALRAEGGLSELIWSFRPADTPRPEVVEEIPTASEESTQMSKSLKKRGFKFVGPTTCFALMEAIGMVDTHLMGSHRRGCSGLWD